MPTADVDDRETAVAQADAAVIEDPTPVRAAMGHRIAHANQLLLIDVSS